MKGHLDKLILLLLNMTCPVLANSVDPDQLLLKKEIRLEIRSGLGILIYSAWQGLNEVSTPIVWENKKNSHFCHLG